MKSFPLFSIGNFIFSPSQLEKRESWIFWTQNNLLRSLNQLNFMSSLYCFPHLREKDSPSANLFTWWHTRTEGKVHRCALWSACVRADAAVWMPSIVPWLVGSPWVCLRGTWTAGEAVGAPGADSVQKRLLWPQVAETLFKLKITYFGKKKVSWFLKGYYLDVTLSTKPSIVVKGGFWTNQISYQSTEMSSS